MTNALKWFLGLILVVIIGLIIWLVATTSDANIEEEQEPQNNTPAQTINPVLWVSGHNQTQNQPVTATQAREQDVLLFTLSAENKRPEIVSGFVMQTSIQDLVTGATLVDAGGAAYNAQNNTLTWTPQDIAPGQVITRAFSVRVNALTAQQTAPTLRVAYNNEVQVPVTRATVAGTSTEVPAGDKGYKAPKAGVPMALNVVLGLVSVAGFAAARRFRK